MLTRSEFVESINIGNDIMFDFRGKHYTILGWYENGPLIGEQYPADDNNQVFTDGDDLVDHYLIDGKPLACLLNQIEITFSS